LTERELLQSILDWYEDTFKIWFRSGLEQHVRILDPQDCTLIRVDFLQESRAR